MNILFLHSASDCYGSGKILLDIVKISVLKGHVCIVCLPEEGPLKQELETRGAVVLVFESGILRRKYFSLTGIINRLWFILMSLFKLVSIIRRKNIDLIYSNTTGVLVGAMAAKLTGKPHIWHVHEIIVKPVKFVKIIAWLLGNFTNRVIVVSNPVKEHWIYYSKNLEKSVLVIHNGIDAALFSHHNFTTLRKELNLPEDLLLIGMIGRVHFWKGQDYFLKIASRIIKETKNVRFIMVGDAFPGYEYLYDELALQKNQLSLEEYVIDLGFRKDISNILNGIDIFILPSILPDPLPTVILEAMCCARPVVATAHGGAVEMVADQDTGILIPWDNANVAVQKMLPLILSGEKRKIYGLNGLARVQKDFSIESFNENIIKLITSIFPA